MSEVMSTIGSIFSNPATGPILSGASAGIGEIGNLLAGSAQSKEAAALKAQQDKIANLTPSQLTGMVTSAEKPIDNALIQQINNSVQGDMASRGLAEAPGIFAAGESQALAPYVQQNYQTALNQVLTQLGLPLSYASTLAQFLPKQQNMTPAFQLFLQQLSRLKSSNAGNDMSTANAPSDQTLMNALLGGGGNQTQGPISPNPNGIDPSLLTTPSDNGILSLLGATS